MFTHLLVPLDGSPMAEAAVPMAAAIARRCGARITLLHVLEADARPSVHGQRHLAAAQEAQAYLSQIQREQLAGIESSFHVHDEQVRKVASSLAQHSGEFQPDLIIMCTHGPSRLRDMFGGNVAQQLTRGQPAPVLLLPKGKPRTTVTKLMAPLDGQAEHERALAPASRLAAVFGAPMELVTVVVTEAAIMPYQNAPAVLLPQMTHEMLQMRQDEMCKYLLKHVEALRAAGVQASGTVLRGEAASALADHAAAGGVDAVALATHGKAGSTAFWAGTLPPKLLHRLDECVFLMVPASPGPHDAATGG
jgi:nucleotide-binding universal stress UspA family protein